MSHKYVCVLLGHMYICTPSLSLLLLLLLLLGL